jgi:phospholipase C
MALRARCAVVLLAVFLASCGGLSPTPRSTTDPTTNPPATPPAAPPPPAPVVYPQSPVKHLIVLVLQNRSFDHMFGLFPGANGIQAGDLGYSQTDSSGKTVTPFELTSLDTSDLNHGYSAYLNAWDNGNMDKFAYYNGDVAMGYYSGTTNGPSLLWKWAQQYALADNFFASTMASAPRNMLNMIAANDNNQTSIQLPAYGPCNGSTNLASPYTFPNVGDQLTAAKYTWKWFHEAYGDCGNYVPQENPFQYFTSTHSTGVADLSAFFTDLSAGTLPDVSFISPAPWHDLHPGSTNILSAFQWIDNLLTQIQGSSAWADTAVIITFDESGGWWDHVPPPQVVSHGLGMRVPTLVISPFAKKAYISHVQTDYVSILNFIQWNWGLQPLNPRNQQSNNLLDMFAF